MYKYISVFKIVVIFSYFFLYITGCPDPDEYELPPDSLIDPPAAPLLLYPPLDTEYVLYPVPGYIDISFDWTSVEDADDYQLEYSPDSLFTTSTAITVDIDEFTVRFNQPTDIYWHVRARSDKWTWYTQWSASWLFIIQPPIYNQFLDTQTKR